MICEITDLEDWLLHSSAFTYADDTTSSVTDKDIEIVKQKMEEDATQILRFMASNGLIANPNKTAMLFLNHKSDEKISIRIGDAIIQQVERAKLLGITFNAKLNWNDQIKEFS